MARAPKSSTATTAKEEPLEKQLWRAADKLRKNFDSLIQAIADIHKRSHASATKAVNMALTMRNWLIGACIQEFELHGEDRADYGGMLFDRIAGRLTEKGVSNCNKSRLYRYRDFYRLYPQIVATLSPQFQNLLADKGLGLDFWFSELQALRFFAVARCGWCWCRGCCW